LLEFLASLEGLIALINRDQAPAKRRRLRKAADVRRSATPVVEGPTAPLEEEIEEPVVTATTGPVADEATRPEGVTPLEETLASPPPAESQVEEVVRTPSPPRPDALLQPPETPAEDTAGTSTQAPGGADIEKDVEAPPQPPPNTEPEGEATSLVAAAGEAAVDLLATRPPSPAREAHEEVIMENNDAQPPPPPQGPRADPGPSTVLSTPEAGAGADDAAPPAGSWALVVSDRSQGSASRQAAFRRARDALEGLATQLALEEAELCRRYDALAADWARFFEIRGRCRQEDEELQARRDEALRSAQEIRDNAEREALEALAPAQAERKAAAEDREAAAAERQAAASDRQAVETTLAQQRQELADRERKIIAEAETVRKNLEQHRLSLEAREQAMATREADVRQREEVLQQAEVDMNTEREALESRESSLAEAMGKHDEAVAKSNKKLAEKKKEAEAELLVKQKEYRAAVTQSVSKEYAEKFQKQEENFKRRRREDDRLIRKLEEKNATLNSHVRRARDDCRRAEEAHKRVEDDLASLMADMQELNAQVAPVVERVEQAEQSMVTARVLTQQRERMFRSLVTRGNALAAKLGVDAPGVPVHGNADVATYLTYFDQLFSALEGPVAELDDVVDEECRKLLLVAIERVFVNLQRLHAGFDFTSVTEPMADAQLETRLSNSLREEINDYVNRFKRVAAEQASGEEEGDEEEDAEGEDAEEDDAATTSA
jgi:hypothetical protein